MAEKMSVDGGMMYLTVFRETAKIVRHPDQYNVETREAAAKCLDEFARGLQASVLSALMDEAVKEK